MSGTDREPPADLIVGGPPGPRPRTMIAVVVVAAVLLGYLLTRHGSTPPPRSATPTPEASAPGGLAVQPVSASVTDVGPGPRSLRLLVGGASPRVVDGSTGDATLLDVPDAGPRAPVWLVSAGDAVLAFVIPLPPGPIGVPGDPAPELPAIAVLPREAYLIRAGRPAVRLGRADAGLPAQDGGVLVTRHSTGGTVLTEFAANGTMRWQRRIAPDMEVLADTRVGLLVRRTVASGTIQPVGPLELVDPATGAQRRLTGNVASVLTTRGDLVAWLPDTDCPPDCRVRVTDVTTGVTRAIADRPSSAPSSAAFSPNGRLLALTFATSGSGGDAYPDGLVDLLDLGSGRASAVRGYSSGLYPPGWVEWTPDGRLVVMALATFGRERVKVVVAQRAGRPRRFTMLPWEFLATRSISVSG